MSATSTSTGPPAGGGLAQGTLLVVGGAGVTGHWVAEHLGPMAPLGGGATPSHIVIADTDPDVEYRLPPMRPGGPTVKAVHLNVAGDGAETTDDGVPLAALAAAADQVWITVASDGLAQVAGALSVGSLSGRAPALPPLLVFTAAQVAAAEAFAGRAAPDSIVGLHVLVGPDTASAVGHTAVVCLDPEHAVDLEPTVGSEPGVDPERALEDGLAAATLALLGEVGMRPILLSPTDHDRAMAWVEGVSEFVLLSLGAALVDSGVPLELLWEVRTPTFQLLAALVARTYDTVRYEQVASAQLNASRTDPLVRQSLHRAVADLTRRVDPAAGADTAGLIDELDRVARGLPTWFRRTLAQGSEGAVEAVRSTERDLVAASRDASLVGIRRLSGGAPTHVGRVIGADDDQLQLDDRLVVTPNGAVVVDSPWAEEYLAGIGVDARVGPVSLRVHNHATVTGAELDAWSAEHLARYRLVVGVDWPVGDCPNVDLAAAVTSLAPAAVESVEVTDTYEADGLTRVTVEARVRTDHSPESVVEPWADRLTHLLSPEPTVRFSVPRAATPPNGSATSPVESASPAQ